MIAKSIQFLKHQLQAKTRHGVHSPFVYQFVTEVLPSRPCPVDAVSKSYREKLLSGNQTIEIQDFGAGYAGKPQALIQKPIAEVIRSSARRPKEGGLLHRICKYYQPLSCLELGTNLGFSTLYQASAVPESRFVTIEGAQSLARMAADQLRQAGCHRVEVMQGEFMEVLGKQIDWEGFRPQHVLLDGNHREQATLDYFEFLLPRLADGAIIILDDIYWSVGMTRAWNAVIQHPEVSVSMDLWHLGILAVRRPQAKEHFRLRF